MTDNFITGTEALESTAVPVILPYEKKGTYYIEPLGKIENRVGYLFLKRAMDILLSAGMLIVLFPLMIVIAILIYKTSPGNVLFYQERLGIHGKKFKIIKFRTMCVDAEKNGAQWSNGDDDPRITPIGRVLRRMRLDELPQLWCILKGDMTYVGPRPERECFYEEFEKYISGFHERLKVKPGLTGLAQVNGGYDLKPEEKILYDMEYIKNRSVLLDLKIMFRTFTVMVTHEGAK